jgi:hypothetical protein
MKGLAETLGIPTIIGSMLASVTIVLLAGMGYIFALEGRSPGGQYRRAAGWSLLLAAWCEILIIGGIMATEAFQADTYYLGPWQQVREVFPTGAAHALGHLQGFAVRAAIYLAAASIVYAVARRKRVLPEKAALRPY